MGSVEASKGAVRPTEGVGGRVASVGDVGGPDESTDSADDVLALENKDAHAAGSGDHAEEAREEELAVVLDVVEAGKRLGDGHPLEAEDRAVGERTDGFDHGDGAVGSGDGVGLNKNKCALHCGVVCYVLWWWWC